MSKDPAFLFYDGDAARDVSHMNRLERGCYFDFIQAQRKFHGITIEQARKILGKDFETCWSALELILSKEKEFYFIEWVRESMEQRKKHAEKQRKRIQDYWDKKKGESYIPRNNDGKSVDLPLVIEDEIEDEINKENKGAKKFNFDFIEESYKDIFESWLNYKKERKESYKTQTSLEACYRNLKKLSGNNPETAKEIIENSFANNWSGLFPLKNNKTFTPAPIVPEFSSGPDR